jgi:hypothetical protein
MAAALNSKFDLNLRAIPSSLTALKKSGLSINNLILDKLFVSVTFSGSENFN